MLVLGDGDGRRGGVDRRRQQPQLGAVVRADDTLEPSAGVVVVAHGLTVGQRHGREAAEPVVVVARRERTLVGVRPGHLRDVLGEAPVDVVGEVLQSRLVVDVDHLAGGVARGRVTEVAAVVHRHGLLTGVGDGGQQAEVEAEDGLDVALLAEHRALLGGLVAGEVVGPLDEPTVGRRRRGPAPEQVVGVGRREPTGRVDAEQLPEPVVRVAREERAPRGRAVLVAEDVVVRVHPRLRVPSQRVGDVDGRDGAEVGEHLVGVCRPRRRAVGDPFRRGRGRGRRTS